MLTNRITFWWPYFNEFPMEAFQSKELKRKTTVVHRSPVVMNFKITKKLAPQLSFNKDLLSTCYMSDTARNWGMGEKKPQSRRPDQDQECRGLCCVLPHPPWTPRLSCPGGPSQELPIPEGIYFGTPLPESDGWSFGGPGKCCWPLVWIWGNNKGLSASALP